MSGTIKRLKSLFEASFLHLASHSDSKIILKSFQNHPQIPTKAFQTHSKTTLHIWNLFSISFFFKLNTSSKTVFLRNPKQYAGAFKYLRERIKNDNPEVSLLGLELLETLIKNLR